MPAALNALTGRVVDDDRQWPDGLQAAVEGNYLLDRPVMEA